MLVTAFFLIAFRQAALAIVPTLGAASVLVLSLLLWSYRSHIAPFQALMMLMAGNAVVVPAVWGAVSECADTKVLTAMHWPTDEWTFLCVAALVPILMLYFLVLERSNQRTAG